MSRLLTEVIKIDPSELKSTTSRPEMTRSRFIRTTDNGIAFAENLGRVSSTDLRCRPCMSARHQLPTPMSSTHHPRSELGLCNSALFHIQQRRMVLEVVCSLGARCSTGGCSFNHWAPRRTFSTNLESKVSKSSYPGYMLKAALVP